MQPWRAIGNTVPNLTGRYLNLRRPATKAIALPLDQRAATVAIILYFLSFAVIAATVVVGRTIAITTRASRTVGFLQLLV